MSFFNPVNNFFKYSCHPFLCSAPRSLSLVPCTLSTIFAPMKFSAVIFDMDGLLIDSEPLWQQAGADMLQQFGVSLTDEQYHLTTGLRTPEWVDYWFTHFTIDKQKAVEMARLVEQTALHKIKQ